LFVTGVIMAVIIAGPTSAFAAVPSNDTMSGATVVSSLPYSQTLDTTEATTDSDDVTMNNPDFCGAPATEASVWYTFTPSAEVGVVVDVSKSDYSAGVIVADGTPDNFVTCGPAQIAFDAVAGHTYLILAFDDTAGGSNGGTLQIDMSAAPPPPQLDVTIDPFGHVNGRTGVATFTGTFTCSGQADFIELDGFVSQRVGRFAINGYFFDGRDGSACDGTTHPWSGSTDPSSGKFAGGKATVNVDLFACSFFCSDASASRTVTLKR